MNTQRIYWKVTVYVLNVIPIPNSISNCCLHRSIDLVEGENDSFIIIKYQALSQSVTFPCESSSNRFEIVEVMLSKSNLEPKKLTIDIRNI